LFDCPFAFVDFRNKSNIDEVDIVKWLINLGASLDESDRLDNSMTILIHATIYNECDLVKLLIDNGANVNYLTNFNKTALDYATTDEVRELLIRHGAKRGSDL